MKSKLILVLSWILILYGLIGSFISFTSGQNYISGSQWGIGAEATILFLMGILHLVSVIIGIIFILINKREAIHIVPS